MSITYQRTAQLSWLAQMVVSWSMAGGIAGGVLIAGLVVTARLHSMGILILVVMVAATGSMLGTVHGTVLGYLSRPETADKIGWRDWLLLGFAAAAASICAVLFAAWLGISAMAAHAGHTSGILALSLAIVPALAIFAWATLIGWRALEHAYARWPEKRLGTGLVVGAFAILTVGMLLLRGAIPGTAIQLSVTGSLLLALAAALWIISPAVIVTLRLARH